MLYFVALLLGVLAYSIVKFLLVKVPPIAELADILGLVAGVLVALWYCHAI